MEIRRVQVTGGSSFVVTLPKEWVKTLHIQKNDPLGLLMQPDGTLLITAKMTQEQTQRIKEFTISEETQTAYLLRQLIGAYIAGYSSIKIQSKNRINSNIRDLVRTFTQNAIGQEVIEETDTSITLKDLLNPLEMPMNRTIKRMFIIAKSMYEDTATAWKTKDKTLLNEVLLRDNDVDRLHWLIARQHNSILRNVSLVEKMTLTTELSLTYFLISRIIERIGDHIVQIAQHTKDLLENDIDTEIIKKLEEAGILAFKLFSDSITSFFRKNIFSSNKNIESIEELKTLCESINTLTLQKKAAVALSIGYITESIRRIGEYSTDISETVINYLVDVEKVTTNENM